MNAVILLVLAVLPLAAVPPPVATLMSSATSAALGPGVSSAPCMAPAGMTALIDQDVEDEQVPWKLGGADRVTIYFAAPDVSDEWRSYLQYGAAQWNRSPCLDTRVVDACPAGANCVTVAVKRTLDADGNFNAKERGGFTVGGDIELLDTLSAGAKKNVAVHEMGHAVGLRHRNTERVLMNGDTYDDVFDPDATDYQNLLFDYGRQRPALVAPAGTNASALEAATAETGTPGTGTPETGGTASAPGTHDGATREESGLTQIIEDVPAADGYRYNTRDSAGHGTDTAKVIDNPACGYLAVYHWADKVMLASSTDLLAWTHRADLDPRATHPTITATSDSGFVAAFETEGSDNGHVRAAHYRDLNALYAGRAGRTFTAPRTLSDSNEGTPSITSVRLNPGIDHSVIKLGMRYHHNCDTDREAVARLTNFRQWKATTATGTDNALLAEAAPATSPSWFRASSAIGRPR